MATIQGQPKDRTPVIPVLSLYGAGLIDCPLKEYYTDPAAYARGQAAVLETFHPDMLFAPFALPMLGTAFGCRLRYFENHPPNVATCLALSPDELSRRELPCIESDKDLLYIREALRLVIDSTKGETPVAAIALSPVDLPAIVLGIDAWLDTLLFDLKSAMRLLEVMTTHFVDWANALLADGATCLILPIPFGNRRIITPKIRDELVVPVLNRAFQEVKGPIILHHVGTSFLNSLNYLCPLPNVLGLCVGKEDNLGKARKLIQPNQLLLGNIDGPGLLGRSADEVRRHAAAVLKDRQHDPHFILTTSAADIDMATPPENILALREAAELHAAGAGHD